MQGMGGIPWTCPIQSTEDQGTGRTRGVKACAGDGGGVPGTRLIQSTGDQGTGRTMGVKACAGDGGSPWDTSHPVHWGPGDRTDKGSEGLCRGGGTHPILSMD